MLLFSTTTTTRTGENTFEQSELRKSESWPKIHKGKTKYMAIYADNEDILINQGKKRKK